MKIEPDMLCWFHSETGSRLLVRTMFRPPIADIDEWWYVEILSFGATIHHFLNAPGSPHYVTPGKKAMVRARQLTPIPPDEIEAMAIGVVDDEVTA